MSQPTVIGLDVGFQALGIVVAQGRTILHATAIRTERTARKRGVRVADDDVERCRQLAAGLLEVIRRFRPAGAVAEMPNGGAQGARANRSMGMATAVVATLLEVEGLPLEAVTPLEVKKAAAGRKDAAKEDVQEQVAKRFEWGDHRPRTKAEWEHVADAAGALLAAEGGTLMRTLSRIASQSA
ncbi:MAG: crossover junction endodeoxyribonuclease RuvC [Bacillota bacterium]